MIFLFWHPVITPAGPCLSSESSAWTPLGTTLPIVPGFPFYLLISLCNSRPGDYSTHRFLGADTPADLFPCLLVCLPLVCLPFRVILLVSFGPNFCSVRGSSCLATLGERVLPTLETGVSTAQLEYLLRHSVSRHQRRL